MNYLLGRMNKELFYRRAKLTFPNHWFRYQRKIEGDADVGASGRVCPKSHWTVPVGSEITESKFTGPRRSQ